VCEFVWRAFSQCLSDTPLAVCTLKQPAYKPTFNLFPNDPVEVCRKLLVRTPHMRKLLL